MRLSTACLAIIIASFAANVLEATAYPIAGVNPDQRPDGAPVIKKAQRPKNWEKQFHHGVEKPYPPHLGFEDVGAWYTPFSRPGMTGGYDIRGWHQENRQPEKKGMGKS